MVIIYVELYYINTGQWYFKLHLATTQLNDKDVFF